MRTDLEVEFEPVCQALKLLRAAMPPLAKGKVEEASLKRHSNIILSVFSLPLGPRWSSGTAGAARLDPQIGPHFVVCLLRFFYELTEQLSPSARSCMIDQTRCDTALFDAFDGFCTHCSE